MTKTVKIDSIEYKMKIEMVNDRDYAFVTLENETFEDIFIWYYHEETLNQLIEEIKKDLHI